MDQTVRDYVVEQTHRLMEAFSCSGEAKEAAQAWLAALGTDREAEETRKYVQELEEDLVTVDQLIAFAESDEGRQVFGAEAAPGWRPMGGRSRPLAPSIVTARPARRQRQFWRKRTSC